MRKLRRYFLAFLFLLAVPSSVLLLRTYDNLEEESFYFYRKTAEGLVSTLGERLQQSVDVEERRPYTQYRYIHVADQPVPERAGLNLSPLAAFPVESDIPGILGYFQIDPDGSFHTPLLPDSELVAGTVPDRAARLQIRDQMASLLGEESFRAQAGRPGEKSPAAVGGNRAPLKDLESNADPRLENEYLRKDSPRPAGAKLNKEEDSFRGRKIQKSSPQQALVFENQTTQGKRDETDEKKREISREPAGAASGPLSSMDASPRRAAEERQTQLSLDDALLDRDSAGTAAEGEVEAEVDPFQVQLLDRKWLVFRRKVWWRDRRYIQGFVARADQYLGSAIRSVFENSALADPSCLVLHRGELLQSIPETKTEGGARPLLLLSAAMPHPFSEFTLAVTVKELPPGPGYEVVNVAAIFMVLLVIGGCFGIYRFTAAQMELSQRKSDFVAAVSHELKTPLASIRMYGEMLVEGWVDGEDKKKVYYRHIRDESERLTRLIQNVLRLAELERNELKLNPRDCEPVSFVRGVVERLGKQIETTGFDVVIETEGDPRPIWADPDALTQVLINLIDNALKFSKQSDEKRLILTVSQVGEGCSIRVRDFGPGIPKGKLNKIFERFYRIDGEATRTTRGTGIGLALVKTLSEAMGAKVDVVNRKPGAEFRVRFGGGGLPAGQV